MRETRPFRARCVTPTCHNDAWISARIFLCEPCANDVMTALSDKVEARITRKVKAAYYDLRETIRRQEQTITRLEIELVGATASRPAPAEGVVYYVQVGSHVKIGWTSNLENRMRQYPPNSTLLAQHPGTRKDENHMHRRFAADRTHGREWYVPSASLTRHITNVVREHGQPDTVSFGAKPVEIPMPHRIQTQKMLAKLPPRHVS